MWWDFGVFIYLSNHLSIYLSAAIATFVGWGMYEAEKYVGGKR